MRVLLISQYYYPEPVEKVHSVATQLVRMGHEVEVVTGFPCYPYGRIYPGYRQTFVRHEVLDGVRITRVPQIPDHSRSALRRAVYYVSFALTAAVAGVLSSRADVVLVYQSALPVGLSAWLVSRLRRTPYVLDVVDLWPESVIASGMLHHPLAIGLIRRVARFIYGGASEVMVVTKGFRENLRALGVPDDKLTVVYNWMPSGTYQAVSPDAAVAEREGMAGRFNVLYAGNMGAYQHLRTVLDAARLLADDPSVQFVLVGDGVEYQDLVERCRSERIENVRFLGRRPPESMASLYALADVLLVHLKPDSLTEVSIPSKTYAYMASGRPVLMGVRGEAARFVHENAFGLAVEPCEPKALADAVRRMRQMPREALHAMADSGRQASEREFSEEVQSARMAAVLNRAMSRHGRPAVHGA